MAFNMDQAIIEARQNQPKETKNMTFVDLDATNAKQLIQWWINSLDRYLQIRQGDEGLLKNLTTRGEGFALSSRYSDWQIIGVHSQNPAAKFPSPNALKQVFAKANRGKLFSVAELDNAVEPPKQKLAERVLAHLKK